MIFRSFVTSLAVLHILVWNGRSDAVVASTRRIELLDRATREMERMILDLEAPRDDGSGGVCDVMTRDRLERCERYRAQCDGDDTIESVTGAATGGDEEKED